MQEAQSGFYLTDVRKMKKDEQAYEAEYRGENVISE
jgi:predicted nucleic acid-binding Zn ribbon protein